MLTVLRGTSKFIITVEISPSALVQETASQNTEAEAALAGFHSTLRLSSRPTPCGSSIFQGVTIAEGSHELFAPLARKTEATILHVDRLKAFRHATSKTSWPRPVNLSGRQIQESPRRTAVAAAAISKGSAAEKESMCLKFPAQARREAAACHGGCNLGAIQGLTEYNCGADGSFAGCFIIEWGLASKAGSVGKENGAPPFNSADAFVASCAGKDDDEPLYRPLLVDFSRRRWQRRVGDMAVRGSVCQDDAAG
ncbi:unnamed protein product [Closterium sp. NIES-64]|nr:unnamed protein product [Closterium sp. NIES-64]CAI5986730.1 unnamed protein product [Closterium sp. NIES-64]